MGTTRLDLTNNNFILEPCVLGGLCDGRHPNTEPAVVEGAPPVPMVVKNWVITVDGAADKTPLRVGRKLKINSQTESFVNDQQADAMLTREYRRGFEVPAKILARS